MISPEKIHDGHDTSPESAGLTPHELVRRQIADPDYHVTDEDIEHMHISADLSEEEKLDSGKESEELENDQIGTSYDVLD